MTSLLRLHAVVVLLWAWGHPFLAHAIELPGDRHDAVNAVLEDRSYEERFGHAVPPGESEELRVRVHLEYVLAMLRQRAPPHPSPESMNDRERTLAHLEEYIRLGQFPHNHGIRPGRRPVFIDQHGRICAVGFLFAKDEGRAAAEQVAAEYRYARLRDMRSAQLTSWVGHTGLSLTELEMIQPGYARLAEPEESVVSLFAKKDFQGPSIELPEGRFTQSQLLAMGVRGNDVLSARIGIEEYYVTFYAKDNFSGASFTFESWPEALVPRDDELPVRDCEAAHCEDLRKAKGWITKVSSIVVSTRQKTNPNEGAGKPARAPRRRFSK